MSPVFRAGDEVEVNGTSLRATVLDLLGEGGQGEVYRAILHGEDVALKWYHLAQATPEQRKALERLVRRGPPDKRFLWPRALVSAPRRAPQSFGYVMAIRDDRFASIVDLMKRRVEPSFRALATAGFQLADSFLALHSRGLCYRDISFGNVFFDPRTGDVLVCDNDNVTVDGSRMTGVQGTPRFMAPEIVRGEAAPTSATDLWSLSVLLFYLFMVHHPLEGRRELEIKCLDLPAMTRLYGSQALFLFDPSDPSNRPVPGEQDNPLAYWPLYPDAFRTHFLRSFTDGVRDPAHGRVRESEWRAAMVSLRDAIRTCPSCSAEAFIGAGAPERCWSCRHTFGPALRVRLPGGEVVLESGTQLYRHHLELNGLYDFDGPRAIVQRHPQDPSRLGLKNLGGSSWTATDTSGQVHEVASGRSVSLTPGLVIGFGATTGTVLS